jgi:hypothetical protein
MKKMLLTPLIVCMVALLPTLYLPAVLAKKPITLRCNVFIDFNYDWVGVGGASPFTWIGTVWGDINGDFYVSLVDASFPGKTEHFSETWIIETNDGEIEGYDVGVWTFANFKWGANGAVTSATEGWSHLVGYDMRYSGTTTDPDVPFGVPINGTGTLHLSSG